MRDTPRASARNQSEWGQAATVALSGAKLLKLDHRQSSGRISKPFFTGIKT